MVPFGPASSDFRPSGFRFSPHPKPDFSHSRMKIRLSRRKLSNKAGLEVCGIVLPRSVSAPRWARDRAKAWNAAEGRETNKDKRAKSKEKANARPARDVMFSYPFASRPPKDRDRVLTFILEMSVGGGEPSRAW
jgi:hypothetical protein